MKTPGRYGCFSHAPYLPHVLLAGDYHLEDGILTRDVIKIPFRMAMDCNYRLTKEGREDRKCEGCSYREPKA